jgi:MoaA/NifB/PqqE/SkfB family radical SAM enzyme
MYAYEDIRRVHLEISSECNAECPLCPRNFHSYPMNNGYTEHSMTLAEAQTIFEPEFLSQLTEILINGNFGDIVMCPEAIDIIRYFRQHNNHARISISTNAGARPAQFWRDLVELNCVIHFCIDGLEDTHSIYRRNTLYNTVLKNAQTYIAAGGKEAIWKFIVFDHNRHQIQQARELSEQLGFHGFAEINAGRTQGPVYNRDKELVYYLGAVDGPTDFDGFSQIRLHQGPVDLTRLAPPKGTKINCRVKKEQSVYVTSVGEVYPCCWLGFSPQTFGGQSTFVMANHQLRPMIQHNNALEYGLKKSIEWFNQIEETWDKPTYKQGRLHICDNTCG